jgi:dipeptidyl aminopeptidase/acylaminoacyl peptidase
VAVVLIDQVIYLLAVFRPSQLRHERLIQRLAVAPDGQRLAYSVRSPTEDATTYRNHIVVLDVATGEAIQRTEGDVQDGFPTFTPDGGAVVFLSLRTGAPQAFALRQDGEVEQLTELPFGVRSVAVSPDGSRLVCLAPSGVSRFGNPDVVRVIEDLTWRADGLGVRDQFMSAWEIPLNGSDPRRLTAPGYEVQLALWRADSEGICFLADRSTTAALDELPQAWTLSLDAEEPELLCSLPGAIFALAVAPGGRVAYAGPADPGAAFWAWGAEQRVFVHEDGASREVDLGGGTAANMTYSDLLDPDGTLYPQLAWVDDERLVTLVAERGRTRPVVIGLDGTHERLGCAETVCFRVATGGGRIACALSSEGAPAEVYVDDGDDLRRLTDEGAWLRDERIKPTHFTWSAPELDSADAWLVTRAEPAEPGPLVLHIHGGPYASHGPTPWLEMIALADAGIPVLYLNPPGSAGYGIDYTRLLTRAWGSGDEAHLLAGLDLAVERGIADPSRVGVMGLSYGGFAALWLIGRHPGRFAAAVCENPPSEFISWAGSSDFGALTGPRGIDLGTLPDDHASYAEASAFAQLTGELPPLLLLQSELDLRCPPHQTEVVFTALRRRGKQVTMVRYPNEPHGMVIMGRPDRRIDRLERIVGFFQQHLTVDTADRAAPELVS